VSSNSFSKFLKTFDIYQKNIKSQPMLIELGKRLKIRRIVHDSPEDAGIEFCRRVLETASSSISNRSFDSLNELTILQPVPLLIKPQY